MQFAAARALAWPKQLPECLWRLRLFISSLRAGCEYKAGDCTGGIFLKQLVHSDTTLSVLVSFLEYAVCTLWACRNTGRVCDTTLREATLLS